MEVNIDPNKIYSQAKLVLLSPKKFFQKAKDFKGQDQALGYYLVIALIGTILTLIGIQFIYPLIAGINPDLIIREDIIDAPLLEKLLFSVVNYFYFIIVLYVASALLFLWFKLWKISAPFNKVFNLYAFASTPNILLGWLPYLSFLTLLWGLLLVILATKEFFNTSYAKSALVHISGIVTLFLLLAAVAIYALPTPSF